MEKPKPTPISEPILIPDPIPIPNPDPISIPIPGPILVPEPISETIAEIDSGNWFRIYNPESIPEEPIPITTMNL